jgi:hypothetical protein
LPDIWTPESLSQKLAETGVVIQSIETVETTLEDVFNSLAHA